MQSQYLDNYFQFRLSLLMRDHLQRIGKNVPSVANIKDVMFEDLGSPKKDACSCNKGHLVQHIYYLPLADGSMVRAGTQCLPDLGYPKSLVTHLEKARRIVQKDVAGIQPLSGPDADIAAESCRTQIDLIIKGNYVPGLLFLQEHGNLIREIIAARHSLPPWLASALGVLAHEAGARLSTTQPPVQVQQTQPTHAGNEEWLVFLRTVNDKIHGRAKLIRDVMGSIQRGEPLAPATLSTLQRLKEKFNEELLERTEKALPFLVALNNGNIHLSDFDATPAPGHNEPMLKSFMSQVNNGFPLSPKQFDVLTKKYTTYSKEFVNLPIAVRQTTEDLLKRLAFLRAHAGSPQAQKEIEEVSHVLNERGVEIHTS